MSDIDYNEVFEVEGAEEQEVAEPVLEDNEGEKEQEVAEPVEEAPAEDKPEQQSEEENRRYAAIRRKAEAEAALKAQKDIDSTISSLGLVNPYNEKLITNKRDLEEYQNMFLQEQQKKVQESSGMTQDEYNRFVNSLPEVKAGKEAQQKIQDMEIRAKIDSQMKEISRISPEIKTMEDLSKLDNFQEIYQMVERGYQLADAYKVLNYDKLKEQAFETAKQQTLNSINGKSHLQSTTTRGTGAVPVPSDVLDTYRTLMPNASDAEIQAHYNKYARKE